MAKNLPPYDQAVDEDYIDMDISSTTFICYTLSSPPHSRDFEFHMSSSTSLDRNPITSPADELFYKGKLLPLHLPPRLKMVQTLLENNIINNNNNNNTPFQSCNISPSTSCYVSGELNPNDYFSDECSVSLVQSTQKKSWSKKLKLIKHSSLSYLKSLFSKSRCSDESTAVPHDKITNEVCSHRRSFSSAIKWHTSSKSSSTSSTSSSSCSSSNATPMLKRSSSVNSEVEISIQGAIAYCKKSQQLVSARKSVSEVGFKDFCR
ncbi:hypothetical protein J5N97_002302 [Dioscorea zingiberensis]|uniref:Membrane-associated kinase regulator 4 n=1 Tax=Dioscorea zingiberensis TaxID=325984 RepID=A0A9D5D1Z0_9LILI|nr:hypothetical protein J5N97_002302 [Dioscorea zingiberensis]